MKPSELTTSLLNEEGLNEREQAFLTFLFEDAKGQVRTAMTMAGYPKDYPVREVTKKLGLKIRELSKEYLTSQTASAAISISNVLVDPSAVGAKNVISASKEILDRGGVYKEEEPKVTEVRNMFILPPKDEGQEEDE